MTRKNNTSGYTGVSRHKLRWRVRLYVDGVCHRAHGFLTALDAAREYNKMALELCGDAAKLNDVMGD